MKCLSIRQPWAGLIVLGLKDIENRTWGTSYRGEIAIHAGKRMDDDMAEDLDHKRTMNPFERIRVRLWDRVFADGYNDWRQHPAFARGAIVGTAHIVECKEKPASAQAATVEFWGQEGAIWWRLDRAKTLTEPIPWRGRLGLFNVSGPIINKAFETAL